MTVVRHPRTVVPLVALLFVIAIGGVTSQERSAIAWESDLERAVERGRGENKPIFLVITGGIWCDPCNWFAENTLDDPELVATINQDWIPLRLLDIDPAVSRWDETTVPTVLLLTQNGDEIARIVGNNTAEVITRRLASIRGDDSPAGGVTDEQGQTDLTGAVFRIGTGSIWNADGGKWYTEDIGLPPELEEYDRDSAFLYLRDPKSATVVAITVSLQEERYLWRWNREENNWDEIGALRRIE